MGCWNQTCGLSNLPILGGEPVVVVLCCYARYGSSNEGEWFPVSLPVEGEYDEYGFIEYEQGGQPAPWTQHPQWAALSRVFKPIAHETWRKQVVAKHRDECRQQWRYAKEDPNHPQYRDAKPENRPPVDKDYSNLHRFVKERMAWRRDTVMGTSPYGTYGPSVKTWAPDELPYSFFESNLGLCSYEEDPQFRHNFSFGHILFKKAIWDEAMRIGEKVCRRFQKEYYKKEDNPWDSCWADEASLGAFLPLGIRWRMEAGELGLADITAEQLRPPYHFDSDHIIMDCYRDISGPRKVYDEVIFETMVKPLVAGQPTQHEGFRDLLFLHMMMQDLRMTLTSPSGTGSQQDLSPHRLPFLRACAKEAKAMRAEDLERERESREWDRKWKAEQKAKKAKEKSKKTKKKAKRKVLPFEGGCSVPLDLVKKAIKS